MSDVETVTSPFRFVSGSRQMNSKHSSNEDTTLEHITQVINELNFTLGSPLFSLAKGAGQHRDFAERRDQDIFFPHKKSGSVS